LSDAERIDTFVAYLITQNISAHVDREANPPAIWIKDEDRVDQARALLERFQANPSAPEYTQALNRASEILRGEARKLSETRKRIKRFEPRAGIGVMVQAPLVGSLAGICVACWFALWFAPAPADPNGLPVDPMLQSRVYRALAFAAIPPVELVELAVRDDQSLNLNLDDPKIRLYNIRRGEIWRLVTPIFIHFGPWHLGLNVLALLQLGCALELRYGKLKLAAVILVIALISNFLQGLAPLDWDGTPVYPYADGWGLSFFGGISGVVFGLLGFAWMKSRYDWRAGFHIPRATILWAIAWILLGISPWDQQLLGSNMANWAHGAGFIVGIILGYFSAMLNSPLRPKSS
jgi:GlpG protein